MSRKGIEHGYQTSNKYRRCTKNNGGAMCIKFFLWTGFINLAHYDYYQGDLTHNDFMNGKIDT